MTTRRVVLLALVLAGFVGLPGCNAVFGVPERSLASSDGAADSATDGPDANDATAIEDSKMDSATDAIGAEEAAGDVPSTGVPCGDSICEGGKQVCLRHAECSTAPGACECKPFPESTVCANNDCKCLKEKLCGSTSTAADSCTPKDGSPIQTIDC